MYQIQEYLFGWYDLKGMRFDSLKEAEEAQQRREEKRKKRNKKARRNDFKPNGYGVEKKYPIRIIEVK